MDTDIGYSNSLPKTHPFTGRNISWLIEARAQSHPDNIFLVSETFDDDGDARQWTFSEFANEILSVSSGLARLGVASGDFVVVHMDNCPEFLFAWFACVRLGAIPVTTNTRSSDNELRYFIEHSGARFAITQSSLCNSVCSSGDKLHWVASVGDVPILDNSDGWPETMDFSALKDSNPKAGRVSVSERAMCSVQYTSGTTALPKGVVWTHANALWGASVNASHMQLRQDDTSLVYLPLFHTNALCYSTLASLWAAATIVVLPKFSASRFWPLSLKYNCTWASMLPTLVTALMRQPDPEQPHRYRFWGNGFSDVPEVIERWGIKSLGWWGMSETISHGILGSLDLPIPPMSIGLPANEYLIKVVNENNEEVNPGETGRLLIKGVPGLSLFLEYLHNEQATRDSYDEDGWFMTGDLVTTHANGIIFFSDREKDVLKVGGENVSASEVEMVIYGVSGVDLAAVVGQKHDFLDEVPVAFVTSNAETEGLAERIIDHCKEMLSDFKVPREVIIVDEIPRGLMDKIDKKALRKQLEHAN